MKQDQTDSKRQSQSQSISFDVSCQMTHDRNALLHLPERMVMWFSLAKKIWVEMMSEMQWVGDGD